MVTLAKVAVSIHPTPDAIGDGWVAATGELARPAARVYALPRLRRRALPYADGLLTWTAAAVAVVAFGLFLRTLLPSAGFWDTAEAQTVPHTLSIFHPTGFPTYAMLGWLWSQIPLGDVAWRMNSLSAVCVATSAGLAGLRNDRAGQGGDLWGRGSQLWFLTRGRFTFDEPRSLDC